MDGRTQAEDLLEKLIRDELLMKSVLSTKKPEDASTE
jgi:hypothetical protein